jgi:hypothetical protein
MHLGCGLRQERRSVEREDETRRSPRRRPQGDPAAACLPPSHAGAAQRRSPPSPTRGVINGGASFTTRNHACSVGTLTNAPDLGQRRGGRESRDNGPGQSPAGLTASTRSSSSTTATTCPSARATPPRHEPRDGAGDDAAWQTYRRCSLADFSDNVSGVAMFEYQTTGTPTAHGLRHPRFQGSPTAVLGAGVHPPLPRPTMPATSQRPGSPFAWQLRDCPTQRHGRGRRLALRRPMDVA